MITNLNPKGRDPGKPTSLFAVKAEENLNNRRDNRRKAKENLDDGICTDLFPPFNHGFIHEPCFNYVKTTGPQKS